MEIIPGLLNDIGMLIASDPDVYWRLAVTSKALYAVSGDSEWWKNRFGFSGDNWDSFPAAAKLASEALSIGCDTVAICRWGLSTTEKFQIRPDIHDQKIRYTKNDSFIELNHNMNHMYYVKDSDSNVMIDIKCDKIILSCDWKFTYESYINININMSLRSDTNQIICTFRNDSGYIRVDNPIKMIEHLRMAHNDFPQIPTDNHQFREYILNNIDDVMIRRVLEFVDLRFQDESTSVTIHDYCGIRHVYQSWNEPCDRGCEIVKRDSEECRHTGLSIGPTWYIEKLYGSMRTRYSNMMASLRSDNLSLY